ncbi:Crp/Fnr family transcriptional regulator [Desulfovibrio intestinalis]|uniref:CRP-like cAMP-binding protein n=1 Tax=Desulfovibrio intestinalis TaxID=58621 RepID=A0A7W8C2G8_9BACT|nr:Crp/Fnr family transcriptional regulator [Desulfovibrio intestinalis]MBB5142979.1 CRP-like cAMP-binding protein [Desulfovibrio intestinalis]
MSFIELFKHNECWGKVVSDKPRRWGKGWRFSDESPLMYYLLSGRVRLMALDAKGNEKTLWYLGNGCCFNETVLFESSSMISRFPARRVRFYHECTKNCYLHAFSRQDVEALSREKPELLINLCESYSKKVGLLAKQLVSLSLESPLTRVCKYLASRIVPGSNPLCAHRDMSYREMADLLGMHRTSIHKVMRQWQAEGIWDFDRNSSDVIILQPDAFFEEASM